MRFSARIKTAFIIVLVVCAVYLSWLNYDFERSLLTTNDSYSGSVLTGEGFFRPLSIAAGDSSSRLAVTRNNTAVATAYSRLTPLLAELLGSASTAAIVTKDRWEKALTHNGMFFDFYGISPVGSLARTLGTSGVNNSELLFSCLFLDFSNETVQLLFAVPDTGNFYMAETPVSSEDTQKNIALPGGYPAQFAFELSSPFSKMSGNMLFSTEPLPAAVSVFTPDGSASSISEISDRLLLVLGFNSYTARNYVQDDGTQVYVGNNGSLSLSTENTLIFAADNDGGIPLGETSGKSTQLLSDSIAAAASLISEISSFFYTESAYYVSNIKTLDTGFEIVFGCHINGAPIGPGGRFNHAVVRVENNRITTVNLRLVGYNTTTTPSQDVTLLQAAAGLAENTEATIIPVYTAIDAGLLRPRWVVVKEAR